MHRFLPRPHLLVFLIRIYINLPNLNGNAQVEQLDAVAATHACGVVTTWIGQIHWKWNCTVTRSGKRGTTNRRNWSTKEMDAKDVPDLAMGDAGDAVMIHTTTSMAQWQRGRCKNSSPHHGGKGIRRWLGNTREEERIIQRHRSRGFWAHIKSMEIIGGAPPFTNGEPGAGWQWRYCYDSEDSDNIITGITEQLYVVLSWIARKYALFLDLVLIKKAENLLVEMGRWILHSQR